MRLSATDWAAGPEKGADGEWLQWGIEQTVLLVGELKKLSVDLVDVSSGGNWAAQKIPVVPGYQVRRSLPPSLRLSLGTKKMVVVGCALVIRFRLRRRSRRRTLMSLWVRSA